MSFLRRIFHPAQGEPIETYEKKLRRSQELTAKSVMELKQIINELNHREISPKKGHVKWQTQSVK